MSQSARLATSEDFDTVKNLWKHIVEIEPESLGRMSPCDVIPEKPEITEIPEGFTWALAQTIGNYLPSDESIRRWLEPNTPLAIYLLEEDGVNIATMMFDTKDGRVSWLHAKLEDYVKVIACLAKAFYDQTGIVPYRKPEAADGAYILSLVPELETTDNGFSYHLKVG